ncbi:MAG: hypothetical protein RIF32_02750 [Leptospirales bacterium]
MRSQGKADLTLPALSEREKELAEDVYDRLSFLSPLAVSDKMNDSEKEWTMNRIALRELMRFSDLRIFLRWQVIRHTMFATESAYTKVELAYLRNSGKGVEDLREDPIGSPDTLIVHPQTSGNLVHHEYHLVRFEREQRIRLSDFPFILEFGGGYGSLCRLIARRNFGGIYVIFDLPEFSLLQRYFLKSLNIQVNEPDSLASGKNGVYLLSAEQDLETLLASKTDKSLFIGTWSISETPLEFRENFLRLVGDFSDYLIAYQNQFNEMNNAEYFARWSKSKPANRWKTLPIDFLPGHAYLFGNSD